MMRLIRTHFWVLPVAGAAVLVICILSILMTTRPVRDAGATSGRAQTDDPAEYDIFSWRRDEDLDVESMDVDDRLELEKLPQVDVAEVDLVWVDHLTSGACVQVRYKSRVEPPSRWVKPVDCAEGHDVDITGVHLFDVASHPDVEALRSEVWTSCIPEVQRYTGKPVDVPVPPAPDEASEMLNAPTVGRRVVYWVPSDDELQRGDRYVVCGALVGTHPDT